MAAGAHPSVSTIRSAIVVRQRFFGIFWPLFLAGSERLRANRLMTDAAHHQHSESRRPSDRDRIVTTGPSRFHPPSLDQSASAITPWHLYGSGRTATFRIGGAVDTTAHYHCRLFRHHRSDQNLMGCSDIIYKILVRPRGSPGTAANAAP